MRFCAARRPIPAARRRRTSRAIRGLPLDEGGVVEEHVAPPKMGNDGQADRASMVFDLGAGGTTPRRSDRRWRRWRRRWWRRCRQTCRRQNRMIGNRSKRNFIARGAGRLRGASGLVNGCGRSARPSIAPHRRARRGPSGMHSSKAICMHSSHWSRSALAMPKGRWRCSAGGRTPARRAVGPPSQPERYYFEELLFGA